MNHVIDQIQGTLNAGFPYAAIMLTLAAPDICANLDLPPEANESGQQRRYRKWYRENVMPKFDSITDKDAWSLRCGVVHAGIFGGKDKEFDRVIFTCAESAPVCLNITDTTLGDRHFDRVLIVNAHFYCNVVIESVKEWFQSHATSYNVQRNLNRLVRDYPDGIPQIFGGTPCIG